MNMKHILFVAYIVLWLLLWANACYHAFNDDYAQACWNLLVGNLAFKEVKAYLRNA